MRIISGSLKGRIFDSPDGHKTHPMSEKIRGAIFNILGDVEGLTVFDAFAGSGAVAFEAISRGAKSALCTDITTESYRTILRNAVSLGIQKKCKVVRANASGWSDNNPRALFDIIIADPPYDDTQPQLLNKLAKHLKLNGVYILSLPSSYRIPDIDCTSLITSRLYGDAQVHYLRRI